MAFHPFNSANFILDRSIITCGIGCGERIKVTATWSVVRHPEGIVVIDTGLNSGVISDADEAWGTGEERLGVPEFPPERQLTKQLAAIGIAPSDVRYVVMTHLHGDHGGANDELPDATFLVQRVEYDYARAPDIPSMVREYPLDQLMLDDLDYQLLDDDHDVFGDGRLRLLRTPGHTPGHQSVLVQLPETGPLLITGDACQADANRDEMTLPSIIWFPSEYVRSRRRLLELAEAEGATWFHTHDPDTFGSLGWNEGAAYG
ncbi:MAG: N-acyl homoserine lactonase family protein [Solirubrobacteraceae bacterium]